TATARFIRRLLWTSGVNSEPGEPSRKGTTPRSMLHEAGQNLVTEQADATQHACGIHARPLHAHDQVGDAEPGVIARDLLPHALGIADEEPIAGERREVVREALSGRQGFVLLPGAICDVFGLEKRLCLRERRLHVGRDVALANQRNRPHGWTAQRLARLVKSRELTLER